MQCTDNIVNIGAHSAPPDMYIFRLDGHYILREVPARDERLLRERFASPQAAIARAREIRARRLRL